MTTNMMIRKIETLNEVETMIEELKAEAESIPDIFYKHYPSYKNGSLNLSELSRVCCISRTTTYKYLSILEK